MKKVLSLVMILLLLMSYAVVAASAVDSAETQVSVKKGDEVVYTLKLTVPEKVVGCDFSVYYDSSVLKIKEFADFTNDYNEDNHQAVINANLKDEFIANWSILKGVKFNDNNTVCKIKFEASKNAKTHISYYVRYSYPESLQMFTDYKFTCSVEVNGKAVIENEAPELNVKEEQPHGQFINSVTGDGKDADINTADKDKTPEKSEDDVTVSNEPDVNKPDDKGEDKNTDPDATEPDDETTVTDSEITENTESTPSEAEDGGIYTSIWFWVIIGAIALSVILVVVYFALRKGSK